MDAHETVTTPKAAMADRRRPAAVAGPRPDGRRRRPSSATVAGPSAARPFEVSPDRAVQHIVVGHRENRRNFGFTSALRRRASASAVIPVFLRRLVVAGFKFHVGPRRLDSEVITS